MQSAPRPEPPALPTLDIQALRNHAPAGGLCVVAGIGDSMRPLYGPGDPLLVDRGVTTVTGDGVYVFRIGSHVWIKQLQRIPGANGVTYRAKSANPDYDAFSVTPDMDFEVLGKVVRVWCATDY